MSVPEKLRVWEFDGAELDLRVAQSAGLAQARIVEGTCLLAGAVPFRPSRRWADAGPIIEQEKISVWRYADLDSWHACTEFDFVRSEGLKCRYYCQGPTPLVAAMRCFVASKSWPFTVQECASAPPVD